MRKDTLQCIWMGFLFLLLGGLLIWAIWYVHKPENQISINELTTQVLKSFAASISVFGIGVSMTAKPKITVSEKLLETLNLIERDNGKWNLIAIGNGFIESVAEPSTK